jgi:hypothetical protein
VIGGGGARYARSLCRVKTVWLCQLLVSVFFRSQHGPAAEPTTLSMFSTFSSSPLRESLLDRIQPQEGKYPFLLEVSWEVLHSITRVLMLF